MLDLIKIGNKISTRRKELNMTQYDIADKLFVTHQAVSKWENGKSIPTIEVMIPLTKLLQFSIDYLLDHSEIDEFDYESLFKNYSREVVFNRILNQIEESNDTSKFFYLLTNEERKQYLQSLFNNNLCSRITNIWPYLTMDERYITIAAINRGDCEFSLDSIRTQLTKEERILIYRRKL